MECETAAKEAPEWLGRGAIYQILLSSFTEEGTLKAATGKLPELAELGVGAVYLCPICQQDEDPREEFWSGRQRKTRSARNPYRVKDYFRVEPECGDEEDLLGFIAEAHRLGMRAIIDIVYFHCGPGASFLAESPDFVKRDANGAIAKGPWNFPVLNYGNASLREYLLRNIDLLVGKFGVDGFRCDASWLVPLDFWEEARKRAEKLKPEIAFIAESEDKADQLRAFDASYSFPWVAGLHALFNRKTPVASLREIHDAEKAKFLPGTRFLRYVEDHDVAHNCSQGLLRENGQDATSWTKTVLEKGIPEDGLKPGKRLDRLWGVKAVNAALTLNFALDGIPLLYNGQELADVSEQCIYRKTPIDWSGTKTSDGKARKTLIKRLCELRRGEKALSEGALKWIECEAEGQILSFERIFGEERILALFNLSDAPARAILAQTREKTRQILCEGAKIEESEAEIEPFGFFLGEA